jgi:hypothetical protein
VPLIYSALAETSLETNADTVTVEDPERVKCEEYLVAFEALRNALSKKDLSESFKRAWRKRLRISGKSSRNCLVGDFKRDGRRCIMPRVLCEMHSRGG